MNFGQTPIPQRLFDLARERMLSEPTSTPAAVREHLLKKGATELQQTSAIAHNHAIIANRVFLAVCKELRASGEIASLKRGVWATTKFLQAAASPGPG
ncbi:hypothetical protein D3C71_21410 [compost metagenome]